VEELENGESLILLRSDIPEFDTRHGEKRGFILSDNLYSVNFVYKDMDGEIHESWDSTDETMNKDRMPVMVSITLEFKSKDGSENPDRFTTSVALPMAKVNFNEAS
jgi:hypothetical protein